MACDQYSIIFVTLKLRHYDISRAHFKEQPRGSFTSNFPQRIVKSMAKTKLAD